MSIPNILKFRAYGEISTLFKHALGISNSDFRELIVYRKISSTPEWIEKSLRGNFNLIHRLLECVLQLGNTNSDTHFYIWRKIFMKNILKYPECLNMQETGIGLLLRE